MWLTTPTEPAPLVAISGVNFPLSLTLVAVDTVSPILESLADNGCEELMDRFFGDRGMLGGVDILLLLFIMTDEEEVDVFIIFPELFGTRGDLPLMLVFR